MYRQKKVLLIWFVLVFFGVEKVSASCTVSVSPNNVTMGVSSVSHFSVSNTGDQVGNWVRLQSPGLTAYTIAQVTASGWYPNNSASEANFAGGYLEGGTSANFDMTLSETGEVITSMDWEALLSYDSGENFESCGTTTLQVVPAPVAPTISGASLTVGNSSATLTWNTNLTATGAVNYGTTSGYGSSTTTSSDTNHSATLGGLSASTLYHYQIQVTSEGGTTSTADATFTTSAASVTTTTTTTVTNTVTTTNNATVNKTIVLADTVKPVVKVSTKLDKAVAQAPIIEGKIVDSGAINIGIVKVQYSVDDGKSWLLVDEPSGATKVDFSFVPEVYEDGNYQILVRAIDKSGNTGVSSALTLIIDRLPPRIIHSLWRVGPIILSSPYQLIPGVPVQVSVQAVGGVTELSLNIGEEKFDLIKNYETGIWEGEVIINHYTIESLDHLGVIVKAKDGGGNEIVWEMEEIQVKQTNILTDQQYITHTIYRYDELTKRFKVWNGEVYGQDNPSSGKSSWYLPGGRYYIEAKGKRYKTAQTEIFELGQAGVVGIEGEMEKWSIWNFWKIGKIGLKQTSKLTDQQTNKLTGQQISWIEKTEWRGRVIGLTILPIWEPRLAEILGGLNEENVVVIPGANQSSVDLLKNRGSYSATMIADPDGDILSDLAGMSLPITLNINRRGQVEGVE